MRTIRSSSTKSKRSAISLFCTQICRKGDKFPVAMHGTGNHKCEQRLPLTTALVKELNHYWLLVGSRAHMWWGKVNFIPGQAGATTVDATRFRARHVTPLSAMSMSAYDKPCYSRTLNTYLFNFLPLLTQLRNCFLGIAAYKWKALTAYLNECSLLQMCTAAYGWILI